MNQLDPTQSIRALSDAALTAAHDSLHLVEKASENEVEAHHLIAEELRARGLGHEASDDLIHKQVIEMSRLRVSIESFAKTIGTAEVDAIARMAVANGTSFVDVYEMLAANGWLLRAVPAQGTDEDADLAKEAKTKTENGESYPAEAFAYVPDPELPSTWKLRLWESPSKKETPAQVGAAIAAFSPGGFRGQRVELPLNEIAGVKAKVLAAWRKVHPDLDVSEAPDHIRKAEDAYTPPEGVQAEGQRALDWLAEGFAGDGFTDVGRARAKQLANGQAVSLTTIKRMKSYLARHEVDKKGKGWSPGEDGYPSAGRVAWAAWGGDPAVSWVNSILDGIEKAGIREGSFVRWNSSGGPAQGQVEYVMTEGTLGIPESTFTVQASPDDPALLIRIWREGADGWAATETLVGHKASTVKPIEALGKSADAQKSLVVKSVDEQRFTLGPWYVPNMADAHNEWTDQMELQTALWDYVRKGNRDIRLQHTPDTKAGEWVEAMTMPFEITVPMTLPDTNETVQKRFPEGTVFLGVVWEDWAWEMVKKGQIRGYSIGGSAERSDSEAPGIYADVR